ncbi:recombinase XerC [Rummeliibacillus stabekisii]|uniref:recombinase XerC n=1 Tax=Rummeliibacillus stabekisii TaxID=241244 RepID=UPI0011701808|nr:recombinase XerC [Rummeliibacillus stabekisii]MBB5171575.1 hypothetical protein [Rummeliibacillus stabekisii]GEL05543.1 hypothetical protein RST01_21700 [Rummeliibacillus stabekisii]
MLFGFEEYRLKQNIKPTTLKYEIMCIKQLIAYLNSLYKKDIEPSKIKPSDIHSYIEQQLEKNKISTVNRKIGHIKNWFDYLWKSGQISYDFTEKISFIKEDKIKSIDVNYKYLLDKKVDISAANIPITAKLIYILYLKGLRPRDIYEITTNDFKDTGNSFILNIETLAGYEANIVFSDPTEIGILLSGIERAIFRDVPYILSSKDKRGYYDKFNQDSHSNYIEHIVKIIGCSFSSGPIRHAYIKYLFSEEKKSVEEISKIVGTSISNIGLVLKKPIESHNEGLYNVV